MICSPSCCALPCRLRQSTHAASLQRVDPVQTPSGRTRTASQPLPTTSTRESVAIAVLIAKDLPAHSCSATPA
jgi:hypothetical protein